MHTPRIVLSSGLVLATLACGDPAPSHVASEGVRLPEGARSADAVASRIPTPDASRSDVSLVIADRAGARITGRWVTVADALGSKARALSDADGRVHFPDVALPYDVAVEGAPFGILPAPWVVLRVPRASGRITTGDPSFHAAAPKPARIQLGLLLPPEGGSVEVVSTSKGGSGRARMDVLEGRGSASLEVVHHFDGDVLGPEDDAVVHVLFTTSGGARARYGRATVAAVRAGERRDVGMVDTEEVPLEEVEVGVTPDLPPGFACGVGLAVGVPGATLASVEGRGHALAAMLPRIPDGTLSAWAHAERGSIGVPGDLHVGTRSWVTGLPVDGVFPIGLTFDAAPEPGPALGGELSRSSGVLTWSAQDLGEARLATLTLADRRSGRVLFRVKTGERAIALARLVALGVPLPVPGPHLLDVATAAGIDVADVTAEPQPEQTWGRATSRRFAFDVIP